ncbi:ABC transporter ATP-binding protein [Formosa sp. S-31]|uniref:ABC transporter ATP-binding protein n=1 Tax=Formosa sp. S-31 TaxID=2790949 RepID=UPI003EB7B4D8
MLEVNNLSFGYNDSTVLKDLSFSVKQGEHLSVIGESGSGKSTLLKLLYGTYDLNEGYISWKKQAMLGPKFNLVIGYDFMKYVAQEFDLMPFISVEENISKFLSNFYPEEKERRTQELLELVELTAFAKVKVKLLSGGQKQRVALARAIARQPEIILLDEPFSHIDSFQKQTLRRNLFQFLKDKNITCIVATHDREDVLPYADKMMVLNKGELIATGTPKNLFKAPEKPLIASFFGEYNTIDGSIVYAHQLKLTETSQLKVKVIQNYFKGSEYLIAAEYREQIIYFYNDTELQEGLTCYLKIVPL